MRESYSPTSDMSGEARISLTLITLTSSIAMLVLSGVSFLIALGSGLASTPDDRVPRAANVLWFISGFAFLPILVVLVMLAFSRTRALAQVLGLLMILAGAAFYGGVMLTGTGDIEMNVWTVAPGLLVVIAAGTAFWRAQALD